MHFGAVAKPPLRKPPLACARLSEGGMKRNAFWSHTETTTNNNKQEARSSRKQQTTNEKFAKQENWN